MADVFDKARAWPDLTVARALGLYPYYRRIDATSGTEIQIDGRSLVMAGSNDYLGLAQHERVREAARAAISRYGSTASGSRLLNGTLALHDELEERLARFFGKEAAFVASTGFQTNLAVLSSLVGRHDTALCDRDIHASLVDGLRLSFGRMKKFSHNDMAALELALAASPGGRLIVTEGVFSMFGDVAALPEIVRQARRSDARILLDDAHGIGVLGAHGRGTAEHFGLEHEIDLIVGTLSKSLASLGGFVTGPRVVIDFIRHKARAIVFSAAMTPASAAAALAALDLVEEEPERRARLWASTARVHQALAELGFQLGPSQTPIIPVIVGESIACYRFAKALFEAGVFVNPVIAPAVDADRALVRTSLMASHTDAQLERIVEGFRTAGIECGLIEGPSQPRPARPLASPGTTLSRASAAIGDELEVQAVRSAADRDAFIELPYQLYADDPLWVPPLRSERRSFLDAKQNPWFDFGSAELFLARRRGKVVGRIAAIDDPRYNACQEANSGLFGFFECIEDDRVARALFDAAAAWVRARGRDELLGPASFSSNYEFGSLIDGFDSMPYVMMAHNPAYHRGLYENAGFEKAKDLFAFRIERGTGTPERVARLAAALRRQSRVEIRKVDLSRFDVEVSRIRDIYNAAWSRNWGFVPMTEREFAHLAKALRPILVPEMALIAEVAGEPVAFSLSVPDANIALKAAGGSLTSYGLPIGLARLLLASRKIRRTRVIALGVKEGHRRRGLEALLYYDTWRAALALGHTEGEISWTLEDNHLINRAITAFGARRYKTYRVWRRALTSAAGPAGA